jgi:quercetin dioxygenase-like cupin family protein
MLAFAAPARGLHAQDAVPVQREPRHRLVLDSARFRVLDVLIAPGDTTLFHIHDTPIMYVDLSPSPVAIQVLGGGWTALPPAAVPGGVRIDSTYVATSVTHRVTNTGTTEFRLLAIISSTPTSMVPTAAQTELPGTVQTRSTWFWQARVHIAPQSGTEWRTSEVPVLIVQPLAGQLDVEVEGKGHQPLEGPGNFSLVPAHLRYRIANRGIAAANAVAIQIR